MTGIRPLDDKLTVGEHLTLRPYYLVVTLADLIQTVVKVAFTIFSALISGLTLGRSVTMNKWCAAHAKDFWLSFKMTAFAIGGIFTPKMAIKGREAIEVQGVNELSDFRCEEIEKTNFIECCGLRVQFVANAVKEAFCVVICSLRYILSIVGEWINFRKSRRFVHVSFHEFLFLGGHFTYALGSVQGAVFPKTVSLMMVKG